VLQIIQWDQRLGRRVPEIGEKKKRADRREWMPCI
jgi:hypothetical protein